MESQLSIGPHVGFISSIDVEIAYGPSLKNIYIDFEIKLTTSHDELSNTQLLLYI